MADEIHAYRADGTLVSEGTDATPVVMPNASASVLVPIKPSAGVRTTQAVTVASNDADLEVSADGITFGASANLGVITAPSGALYVRQTALRAEGADRTAGITVTYGALEDIPDAPAFTVGPAISATAYNEVTVTWTATDADGDAITAKVIVKTTNAAPSAGDWAAESVTTSPHVESGLSELTPYFAFVRLTDATGLTTTSASVTATTPAAPADETPPAQVTGLTVGAMTPGVVPLTWDAIADAAAYKVERATAADFGTNLLTLSDAVATTSYTNNAAGGNAPSPAATYYYRVSAVDAAGNWGAVSTGVEAVVPSFPDSLNDSAIGAWLYTKTQNGGTVAETTVLTTTSTAANHLSVVGIDAAIATGKKVTVTGKTISTATIVGGLPLLGIYEMTTHPKSESSANYAYATISPKMRVSVALYYESGQFRLGAYYRRTDGAQMTWIFSGDHANGWWTGDPGSGVGYTNLGASCPNVRVEVTRTSATAYKLAILNDDTSAAILAEKTMTDVKSDGNNVYHLTGDNLSDYYAETFSYILKLIDYQSV